MKEKIIKSVPVLVFTILLVSTIIAWRIASDVTEQESKNRFYQDSLKIQNWVRVRFNLYILGAEGLVGYIETSGGVKRDEWSDYIKRTRLIEDYPGISALFYIEKVKQADKKVFIESVRKDTSLDQKGYPDFNIYPEEEKTEYFVSKYIEPFKGREKSLGFDISSEKKRLQALERARDSGKISSTGKVISSSSGKPAFGFLLPVYKKGTNLSNLEEKKANIIGFVNVGFRGDEIFEAIYGKNDPFPGIDFEIYDSENLSDDNLLYDRNPNNKISESAAKPGLYTKEVLAINSQNWIILISATEGFGLTKSQKFLPMIVLTGGLLFSFIFLGTYLYIRKSKQAP